MFEDKNGVFMINIIKKCVNADEKRNKKILFLNFISFVNPHFAEQSKNIRELIFLLSE